MAIDINGMAHVILTVSRFEVAREFYRRLLPGRVREGEGLSLTPSMPLKRLKRARQRSRSQGKER
jgi:hypothetical protein